MAKKLSGTEIKKIVQTHKVVIGTEESIAQLKRGKVEKILISSNCPATILADIAHYAELSNAEVIQAPFTNEELAVICKKPFSISVLSILKGA